MEENGKKFVLLPHSILGREMNGFFGRHSAKVDDKGRLVIPSAIKGVVSEDQMKFVIRKDMHSDCLEMFTYAEL